MSTARGLHSKGGIFMTVRERILAIRLLEKQEQNPAYAKRIGLNVTIVQQTSTQKKEVKNHA